MPRRPRLKLAAHPLHVVQRGNNRAACFFAEEDYRFYLHWLDKGAQRYGCDIHAYVLMTNHVHLLLRPHRADSVSALMQSLGRRYVQYVNRVYKRSGTLWEGRFKASLVQAEDYLLIGNQRFRAEIDRAKGRRIAARPRGRPRGPRRGWNCGGADRIRVLNGRWVCAATVTNRA